MNPKSVREVLGDNKKILKGKNHPLLKKMVLDFKKIFSNVFILIGFYYLLVSLHIINNKVIWLITLSPSSQNIFIASIGFLLVGIALNQKIMRKLKNVFY